MLDREICLSQWRDGFFRQVCPPNTQYTAKSKRSSARFVGSFPNPSRRQFHLESRRVFNTSRKSRSSALVVTSPVATLQASQDRYAQSTIPRFRPANGQDRACGRERADWLSKAPKPGVTGGHQCLVKRVRMPAPHTRKDRSCVRRVRSSGVLRGSGSIPGKNAKTAHQNRREGRLNARGKLVHVRAAVTPAADLPTSRLNGPSATSGAERRAMARLTPKSAVPTACGTTRPTRDDSGRPRAHRDPRHRDPRRSSVRVGRRRPAASSARSPYRSLKAKLSMSRGLPGSISRRASGRSCSSAATHRTGG